MATALMSRIAPPAVLAPVDTATLVWVCSPIRGADGTLRVSRVEIPSGLTVQASLPPGRAVSRVILNGEVLTPDVQATRSLRPGDELWCLPAWEGPAVLIPILVGLAVSLLTTGISFLLFPPAKPHIQTRTDEQTFSFEGIRTAIGPGGMKAVVYGRHRIGGQLLSASVDQALTVIDGNAPGSVAAVSAVSTPPTLTLLLGLCHGPIDAVLTETILINGQPIGNFPSVEVFTRLGTAAQAPIPECGETRNTFADGREIPQSDPGIIYTTTVPVQAFVLTIVFAEGLYSFSSHGDKETNTATVQYRWRTHPAGAWSPWTPFRVSAARTSVVRLGIRRQDLPMAVYDIAVAAPDAFNTREGSAAWKSTLESVTEVQQNLQSYPYTALLGIRALATNALQGSLPNITVEVRGRTVRVGSFAAAETWSDNPAWCVMDFQASTRYGPGHPDGSLDLNGYATWAAYNDQPLAGETRHVLNYVLDRELRLQPALLEMAGGSRTLLLKSEGLWSPRPTRDEPPVQLLSWASCTDVQLTYTRDPDRINVMEARFANEDTDFAQDVLTWPVKDEWPTEVRLASLEIRGVTKPSRIMRALQFELNRRRYENMTLELTASLEAIVLQVHDVFRFSHPLPGWGTSGRLAPGSTASVLQLDHPVTFVGAQDYLVYVRHSNDVVEMRHVAYPGDGETSTLALLSALSQTPSPPRACVYAFGHVVSTADSAVRLFRVVKMALQSDTTVRLSAVIHNASIYDEPTASPLPITTELFNPEGPSPPLTSLVLTELSRIQSSGASLDVVNVSWDVAELSTGYAPYGGAMIFRRAVLDSALAGLATAGAIDLGALQGANDPSANFMALMQTQGHVLDWDDYTVVGGTTYVYRVVPLSQRGVPNEIGAREGIIHVTGATTGGFFPGTVQNLRLLGQAVGDTIFEGRDIHITWDPIADSPLFSTTFFVQDYIVEMWEPGQVFLLRRASVPAQPGRTPLLWTYTLEQNIEDHAQNGIAGANRSILFLVWARTNTGRVSLVPAQMTVTNPPPDMSDIMPEVKGLFQAALIDFNQWVPPRDFHHFEVRLDTVNPPVAIYESEAVGFQKLFPGNLLANVAYFVYILPYDTFGAGLASQIATFTPVAIDADSLDTIPPAMPTGLALSTGVERSADGTTIPWVQVDWTGNTESDMAGYEVQLRIAPSLVPTVFSIKHPTHSIKHPSVPGGVTVFVRLLAFDQFANKSPFTAEVSITTAGDTVPPGSCSNLNAFGSIRAIMLLWTPPADADYVSSEVWAATVNNRASAFLVGSGEFSFSHESLGANDTRWYWVRAVDRSGNVGVFYPPSATTGISGTAGQLDTTFISSLAANKIIAGTIQALVRIGVNNIQLDGVNSLIVIYDDFSRVRVKIGKLGALSSDWGMQIFNDAGQLMWNLTDGAQTVGIANSAITASKISAAVITATHLRTDTAVITTAAQIANALIGDAHITNLSASKIIASTIQVLLQLGVGNRLFLDGTANRIYLYDGQSPQVLRCMFGELGGGLADYGLRIWNAAGALMWNFDSGAQTVGIAPNAVSDSVIFSDIPGVGGYTSIFETEIGAITFPTLLAGDRVLVTGMATGITVPGEQVYLVLREDSASGPFHHRANMGTPTGAATPVATFGSLATQTVYVAPSTLVNKRFVLTISVQSVGPGDLFNIKLVGTRVKR